MIDSSLRRYHDKRLRHNKVIALGPQLIRPKTPNNCCTGGIYPPAISATVTAQAPDPFLTAAEHAGMAAQAEQLSEIHQHLQHVLNCLEGSTGKDFKASASNPCTGKGALQTLPKRSINLVRARKAIALARVGVKLHDVPPAHYVSLAIHAILTEDQQRREKVKE